MTRRAGIIAVLANIAGAHQGQLVTSGKLAVEQFPRKLVVLLGGNRGFDSIEVQLGPETIRLMPQEIMDALDGRVQPNHCPACGLDRGPLSDKERELTKKFSTYQLSRCSRCRAAFWRE